MVEGQHRLTSDFENNKINIWTNEVLNKDKYQSLKLSPTQYYFAKLPKTDREKLVSKIKSSPMIICQTGDYPICVSGVLY
jgi:hypothetical protein